MENVSENVLVQRISPARLSSFRLKTDNDVTKALRLYEWNAHLSASIFELLGHVEIIVRNAMHQELSQWHLNRFGNPNWFTNEHGLLIPRAIADISLAQERIRGRKRLITGDRIVSELNFGFWRFLLAKQYRTTLWPAALKNAFPHLETNGVGLLATRLANLHGLRNRIAHHEPIHTRNLESDVSDCGHVIAAVSEEMASWAVLRSEVREVLRSRPSG